MLNSEDDNRNERTLFRQSKREHPTTTTKEQQPRGVAWQEYLNSNNRALDSLAELIHRG